MPKLSEHQSAQTTKMLLLGNNGAGKTGALASLASAGYNLRIIDLDNGLDVLRAVLTGKDSIYKKDSIDRVEYETLTDPRKRDPATKKLKMSAPTVWTRVVELLSDWNTQSAKLGPISTWTSQDVLVIDSLSFLSKAAMHWQLSLNGRLGGKAEQSDWYSAQQYVEELLAMLFDEGVTCNVIIMAHIKFIEINGVTQGYPNSVGKALSPNIGSYFNSVLQVRSSGSGTAQKRLIHTQTSGLVELKNSSPFTVKPMYEQATGLAEYFKDVRGLSTSAPPTA